MCTFIGLLWTSTLIYDMDWYAKHVPNTLLMIFIILAALLMLFGGIILLLSKLE